MSRKAEDKLRGEWFWVDRWDASSAALLTIEERGVYREMLSQAWIRGARLPKDPAAIRRAIRCTSEEWDRSWPAVKAYWREHEDGQHIVNDTQIEIYAKTQAEIESRKAHGRAAAEKSPQVIRKRERDRALNPEVKPEVEHETHPEKTHQDQDQITELTATKTAPDPPVKPEVDHKVVMLQKQRTDYARTVWDAWREKRGRGGPEMSSAEWDQILKWLDGDVPLHVVLRGIEDCGGTMTPQKPLTYAAPAVRDAVARWRQNLQVAQ